jgi:hypothetical protein
MPAFIILLCGILLVLCGVYVGLQVQKKRKEILDVKKAFIGVGIIILIGVVCVGIYFPLKAGETAKSEIEIARKADAWKTRDNKTMAYVMMQEFVSENLKSPASAKFEWITEPACKISKEGFDYTISSWVDSQNAFGAIIRTRFSGVIRQVDKDNWQLLALEFEE